MVEMLCVRKLMNDNVVNQLEGQLHECDIETDCAFAGAAPPSTTGM